MTCFFLAKDLKITRNRSDSPRRGEENEEKVGKIFVKLNCNFLVFLAKFLIVNQSREGAVFA